MYFFFSSFETKALKDEHFDAVDLVETAFNKLAENVVSIYIHSLYRYHFIFVHNATQEAMLILKPCSKQYKVALLIWRHVLKPETQNKTTEMIAMTEMKQLKQVQAKPLKQLKKKNK